MVASDKVASKVVNHRGRVFLVFVCGRLYREEYCTRFTRFTRFDEIYLKKIIEILLKK